MADNETERNTQYDRACRDPRDNCPTENAVLRREWRQKVATIAILSAAVEMQATRLETLRIAADALLTDMGTPEDGVQANLMQAVRDAIDAAKGGGND